MLALYITFRLILSQSRKIIQTKIEKMKKLILSAAALFAVVLSSNAQTDKGQFIVGGQVNYSSVKSDAEGAKATESFNIVPNVGYFVADNIAVGTGVGYAYAKTPGDIVEKTQAFVVSPFGRYYVGDNAQFKFFGQLAVPMAFGKSESAMDGDNFEKDGSLSSIGVNLSPGFAFFPTSRIGIEFALNGVSYTSTTVKDSDDNKIKGAGSETFSIGTDFFSPRIGVQFHF